ncbi:hypothetical protein HK19_09095 [Acetobacter persici]|nr:hypothetical protein HK19_09095 [Acetobacter persici]
MKTQMYFIQLIIIPPIDKPLKQELWQHLQKITCTMTHIQSTGFSQLMQMNLSLVALKIPLTPFRNLLIF